MNLKVKSDTINEQNFDINAEFLVSCLLNEGFRQNRILANFDGHLKRAWSRDIGYSEIEEFENNTEVLGLHLNRSGIYDALPEAMFHESQKKDCNSGEEMAKESMRLKMEEKEARQFFKPFENEIFFQKARIAKNESEIYDSLFADLLNGLIPDFWKIDRKIPPNYVSKLIKLLPFVHTIIGNYNLTAQALKFILDEKVKIKLTNSEPNEEIADNEDEGGVLGEGILGKNLIMGARVTGFIGTLKIEIGPLQNTQPKEYFANAPVNRLINCFVGYFIPMELDVETKLLIEEEQSKFELSDNPESLSYLGFNSVL